MHDGELRIVNPEPWLSLLVDMCPIAQWYSTFFARVPPDIIYLQLCTPKVVGTQCKLYILYNIHLK
jgi:hypothetical protein